MPGDSQNESVEMAKVVLEEQPDIDADKVELGENWVYVTYYDSLGDEKTEHIPKERVKRVESGGWRRCG